MKRLGTSAGFSLVELLLGLALIGVITTAVFEFSKFSNKIMRKMVQKQQNKLAFMEWGAIFSRRAMGALVLTPNEPFDKTTDSFSYRGIHDLKGRADVPDFCTKNDTFSVLRITSTFVKQGGTKLLEAWEEQCGTQYASGVANESTNCLEEKRTLRVPLRKVTESQGNYSPVMPILFDNGEKSHDEVVLVDVDRVATSRYRVLRVEQRNENILGVIDSNPHVAVIIERAQMINGDKVPFVKQKFIAGSLVLPSVTETICVDEQGRLVHNRGSDTNPVPILVPDRGKITNFKVQFLASKSTGPLDLSLFKEFSDSADINVTRCIDYVSVEVEVTPDGANTGQSQKKIFFLPQFHQSRQDSCRL